MSEYINAETAEKSLRQYAEQKHSNGKIELANGILKAVCKLKTLPTADVKEVVRGKWIDKGWYVTTAYGSLDVYTCSNCGTDITIDEHDDFCPKCGAAMEVD